MEGGKHSFVTMAMCIHGMGQRSLHLGQCPKTVQGRAMDYIEPTQAHCI